MGDETRPALLPCPFCGYDRVYLRDENSATHEHTCCRFVECDTCGASSRRFEDQGDADDAAPASRWAEAIAAWNRRPDQAGDAASRLARS